MILLGLGLLGLQLAVCVEQRAKDEVLPIDVVPRILRAPQIVSVEKLLLLDEVTGGVDQPSIPGLIELIGQLRERGVTLLVIEHNMRVIMELADRVVFLHLGRKIAEGPPGAVARDPNVVRLYLGEQRAQSE